jgi:hypothetical protein
MEALFSNSHGVTNLTLSGIETISFGVNCSTTGTQIDVAINTNSAVRYTGGCIGDVRGHRGGYTLRSEPAAQDRQQLPLLGSSLLHLLRITLRKKSTAAFRFRSAVSGSVAML